MNTYMSYKEQADNYYAEHYKGRGLAPKHVVALKAAIAKALRGSGTGASAAKAFFKEKGITLADKIDVELEEEAKEVKNKKPTKAVAPKDERAHDADEPPKKRTKDTKLAVVPLPAVEINKMDRKSLKATIVELQNAGVKIEYDKKDEDDVLRRKINDAMQALPSPEMIKMLESIDPSKLKDVLSKDCFGIFIDIRSASCMACPDVESCTKEYLKNLKGDFKMFRPAMQEIKAEELAATVTEETVKASTKKAAKTNKDEPKAKKVVWDPDRFIAVVDIDIKTLDKEHDTFSTLKAIFKEVPSTFAALREIVEREWDISDDSGFVQDWVLNLRKLGYVKLEADLDDDERKAYVEAGYLKK